ncbi:phage tail protein [Rhizobium sp. BK377]|uniref:phage tail protein n=1 Tax=Rhizobium sp. BK377 TaxID=2587058 RepID=UPI00160EEB24|nr:phage tail protein [Rhizobium sp. BK377]MBB3461975.1 hypothetical protein [Rhizobium sp. BK377]
MGSLLPNSSGLFERALEASYASRWDSLAGAVAAIRTAKLVSPPPSFLPFLIYEYGLGELTPYVPNLYTLVVGREGVKWQRLRGTLAAVKKGLGWIGYTATLEDQWHGRAYWNSTQLRFPDLPAADHPDLERIEGITALSIPKRSNLRRGVFQCDAGPVVLDGCRLEECLLERESGVAVTSAGTLWSFGRTTSVDHVLTEAEGTAIGNWIAPPEDTGLKWAEMTYPWQTATFPWAENAATQRRSLMAAWFAGQIVYATLKAGDGSVIGHRRCRAVHPVNLTVGGVYQFAAATYQPAAGGTSVYIEAMTDFEDADGITAESVELTIGAVRVDGVPPGRLWLSASELSGGHPIAVAPSNLPLRATVREQLKFLVRF